MLSLVFWMKLCRVFNHLLILLLLLLAFLFAQHPAGHVSFLPSGPFPPHCVQGSKGSYFYKSVADALTAAKTAGARLRVLFKGFAEDVDSFGAFKYSESQASGRLCIRSGCSLTWTGGYVLKCSNFDADINAPPDVLAVTRKVSVSEMVAAECRLRPSSSSVDAAPDGVTDDSADGGAGAGAGAADGTGGAGSAGAGAGAGTSAPAPSGRRLFIGGLAFDYCVVDSAVTAASSGLFEQVYIVYDASRAAHIPGVGTFGSGYLTDPAVILKKCSDAGVKFVTLATVMAAAGPPST